MLPLFVLICEFGVAPSWRHCVTILLLLHKGNLFQKFTQLPSNHFIVPLPPASITTMSKSPQNKPKATSLAPLLRHFIDIPLIVETKFGKSFQGRLAEADAFMNLVLIRDDDTSSGSRQLRDTGTNTLNPSEPTFSQIHIRASSIRYIIFSSSVDIVQQIREGRDLERSAVDRYKRGVRKK